MGNTKEAVLINLPLVGKPSAIAGFRIEANEASGDIERPKTVTSPQELVAELANRYTVIEVNAGRPALRLDISDLLYKPEFVLLSNFRGEFGVNISQEYVAVMQSLVNKAHEVAGSLKMDEYWASKGIKGQGKAAVFKIKATSASVSISELVGQMSNITNRALEEDQALPRKVYNDLMFAYEQMISEGEVKPEELEDLVFLEMARWRKEQPVAIYDEKQEKTNKQKKPVNGWGGLNLPILRTIVLAVDESAYRANALGQVIIENPWVRRLVLLGTVSSVIAGCGAAKPTNVQVNNSTATATEAPVVVVPDLPNGPDQRDQSVIPTAVSIDAVPNLPLEHQYFKATDNPKDFPPNVVEQFVGVRDQLESQGYALVGNEADLKNPKDVYVQYVQNPEGWTIFAITNHSILWTVRNGVLTYDPSFVGPGSTFIEFSDNLGDSVNRKVEKINGNWQEVLREKSGNKMGVHDFSTDTFNFDPVVAKQVLGFKADELSSEGGADVYKLRGEVVRVVDKKKEVHILTNGFEFRQNGTRKEIWEWKEGVFKQVDLPYEVRADFAANVALDFDTKDQIPVARHKKLNINYLEYRDDVWQVRPFSFIYDQELSTLISEKSRSQNRIISGATEKNGLYYLIFDSFRFGGISYSISDNNEGRFKALLYWKGRWFKAPANVIYYQPDSSKLSNEYIAGKEINLGILTKILNSIAVIVPREDYTVEVAIVRPNQNVTLDVACGSYISEAEILDQCSKLYGSDEVLSPLNTDYITPSLNANFDPSQLTQNWLDNPKIPSFDKNDSIFGFTFH